MSETPENTARMQQCPSFGSCDAPKCPLDEFVERRAYLSGEPTCKAEKPTRFRIGKELPNLGLLPLELAAYVRTYGSVLKARKALLTKFMPTCGKNNEKRCQSKGNHG